MNSTRCRTWDVFGPSSEHCLEVNTERNDHMSASTTTRAGGWEGKNSHLLFLITARPWDKRMVYLNHLRHYNDNVWVCVLRVWICYLKRKGEKGGGVSERRIVRSRGNQRLLLLTELHLDGSALHCLSPNQPQSINHLPQPASQINHLGSAPTFVPSWIKLHQPIKCHRVTQKPISEHLGTTLNIQVQADKS